MDVSHRALQIAAKRLRLERLPNSQRARIELAQLSASNAEVTLVATQAVPCPMLPAIPVSNAPETAHLGPNTCPPLNR